MDTNKNNNGYRRINSIQLINAELRSISWRLNNFSNYRLFIESVGEDSNTYFKKLVKRRDSLLKTVRQEKIAPLNNLKDISKNRKFPRILEILNQYYFGWETLKIPSFIEGINESSTENGTHGQINTGGLGSGWVAFGGGEELTDDGIVDPLSEKTWIHNWHCPVLFPAMPSSGWLSFRLLAEVQNRVYNTDVKSGMYGNFITVEATTRRTRPDIPDVIFSEFPTWVNLPDANIWDLRTEPSTPITEYLWVEGSEQITIDIYFGVIVQLAAGYLGLLPTGSFDIRQIGSNGPNGIGIIEYSFHPSVQIKLLKEFVDTMP